MTGYLIIYKNDWDAPHLQGFYAQVANLRGDLQTLPGQDRRHAQNIGKRGGVSPARP